MRLAWAVAAKELVDLARDRRGLLLAFLVPVVAVPGLSVLLEAGTSRKLQAPARVAVVGPRGLGPLAPFADGLLEPVPVPDPDRALRTGRVSAVLEFPGELPGPPPGAVELVLRYRENDPEGLVAREKVAQVVARYSLPWVERTLHARGLDREALSPVRLREEPVPGGGGWAALAVPLFTVVWAFAGAALVAADLTAGEKERGTWDLLRSAPVARGSLVAGKFLACWAAGTALAGLACAAQVAFSGLRWVSAPQAVGLATAAGSTAAVAAAAALVVGLVSRSAREANQWALPLYVASLAAAAGADTLRGWTAGRLVPVLNSFWLAQEAAAGAPADWGSLWPPVASSVVVCAALLGVAARLVDRE